MEKNTDRLDYLKLLSLSYPSIQKAASEVINLKAIQNLPKGTEHFISDIHGEFDAFSHILRSGSGVIKDKINETFTNYTEEQKSLLATIIYYPKEKLDYIANHGGISSSFYHSVLSDMIDIAKITASKYTRSKVRKLISPDFVYIVEELLQSHDFALNKENYYKEIINGIIETGRANEFIEEMAMLIQRTSVDHLHILGDIYDRGAGAFRIMELISTHRSIDITWGNHDIVYMGAAAGSLECVCNVIRTSCRYNCLSTIEDGYGISLRPLVTFAVRTYGDDPCLDFIPKTEEANMVEDYDTEIIAKMHKAITIIQLKLDGQFVKRNPNFRCDYLAKLGSIDFKTMKYKRNGKEYDLIGNLFPTIDPKNPYQLTKEEEDLILKLSSLFRHCKKLQEHTNFLFSHGSMYLNYNSNLLFHGAIPTDEDGNFMIFVDKDMNKYSGKSYLDYCDQMARRGYLARKDDPHKQESLDFFYFLWCAELSPIYAKSDITTFERYFLKEEDRKDFPEEKNHYYKFDEDIFYCDKILHEFGIKRGVIINGHMPVKIKKGESPIKARGRLIIIDGGISRAYQDVTGIAGYTLVYNSYGMKLIAHDVFESKDKAIIENKDIVHSVEIIDPKAKRKIIKETDSGKMIQKRIDDLMNLLTCYRAGYIKSND